MAFMETRDGMEDMKEYFQWIKEEEWKQYVDAMEEEAKKRMLAGKSNPVAILPQGETNSLE